MSRKSERVALPARAPLVTVTLQLRSRTGHQALESLVAAITRGECVPLSRREFTRRFAASPNDAQVVRAFAARHRLEVRAVSYAERHVQLRAPADRLANAFGVTRVRRTDGRDVWDGTQEMVRVPAALTGVVEQVLGFDQRPVARRGPDSHAASAAAPARGYDITELARLYGFDRRFDGAGQRIGVIALGGGFLRRDMQTFFAALGVKAPRIRCRFIDAARNAPEGITRAYDGEVTGDIQTVGGLAPGADITVYFAPNTLRGFYHAVAAAVHDRRAANTILSISWGESERHWQRHELRAFDRVLLEAAALGVTVCCSSGDWGGYADRRDRTPHVTYPAASPYALACGGTSIRVVRGQLEERVWHDQAGASGGGVSELLARPEWQEGHRVPKAADGRAGRGVPDVAANADPATGYRVYVRGGWHVGAGTSAAAPFWAGLLARINQARGAPVGLVTPRLYEAYAALRAAGAIVPVTHGGNGTFRARTLWDCCTGLGTPRGARLLKALVAWDAGERD